MLNYSFQIPNLAPMIAALRDIDPPLNQFAGYLVESTRERIQRGQGDPYGKPYRPLTRRYAAQKRQRYGGKPILEASGEMLKSIKASPARSNRVAVGVKSPPGRRHQEGDRAQNLPQRMIFPDGRSPLPPKDKAALDSALSDHLDQAFRASR